LMLDPDIAEIAEDETETFYFTVTEESLWAAPPAWFTTTNPSAATILKIKWNSQSEEWSQPEPHLTWEDLGLQEDDEITALAVDGTTFKVLAGTNSNQRQLWLASYEDETWQSSTYLGTYRDQGGESFAKNKLRLRPSDRFSGICAGDPGGDMGPGELLIRRTLGIPKRQRIQRPCYEISVSRDFDAATNSDFINIYLGSLECLPSPAVTVLFYLEGIQTGLNFINLQGPSGYQVRRYRLTVPAGWPPSPLRIAAEVRTLSRSYRSHWFEITP